MRNVGDYVLGEDIPEQEFYTWIDALRSGNYHQARSNLHCHVWEGNQLKPGYCCLGVACKEVGSISDSELDGVGLPNELAGYKTGNKDKWFREINKDFELKLSSAVTDKAYFTFIESDIHGNTEGRLVRLDELNDDYGLTFDEIADCLEAVYVHRVLE